MKTVRRKLLLRQILPSGFLDKVTLTIYGMELSFLCMKQAMMVLIHSFSLVIVDSDIDHILFYYAHQSCLLVITFMKYASFRRRGAAEKED